WDPATRIGLQRQDEDFGQTLGHYGVPAGPYVMLPGLGPSSVRDAGGRLVDWVGVDQINYANIARNSSEYPALLALRLINARDATPFS
ncbi:MlaA family lipoprotein, partial [Acinetobacter baumannii]